MNSPEQRKGLMTKLNPEKILERFGNENCRKITIFWVYFRLELLSGLSEYDLTLTLPRVNYLGSFLT